MNSRLTIISASLYLLVATTILLNLNLAAAANPTMLAAPRNRPTNPNTKVANNLVALLTESYEDDIDDDDDDEDDDDSDADDMQALTEINNRLGYAALAQRAFAEDQLEEAIKYSRSNKGDKRQIKKRQVGCEFHGLCDRCAKHTKSEKVYSQCCRNEDGRKWCIDFINSGIGGRK